jgi:hypothetical protein
LPEYSRSFAQKLAKTAELVAAEGLEDPEAKRTVLYLSLLSTEISLKAMLEKAGMSISDIRRRSHDLAGLLCDVGRCEIEVQITAATKMYVAASRLRAYTLTLALSESTVGEVIDIASKQASAYPSAIRYGEIPHHYPPELVAQMAVKVAAFAKEHWHDIRIAP